jgi:hypothetical protein
MSKLYKNISPNHYQIMILLKITKSKEWNYKSVDIESKIIILKYKLKMYSLNYKKLSFNTKNLKKCILSVLIELNNKALIH